MDIRDLEKDELVDLAAMLGARLARSVELELTLEIRVRGLERAVEAARKEGGGAWEKRYDNIYKNFLEQQARAEDAEEDLKNVKEQWREFTERTQDDINLFKQHEKILSGDLAEAWEQRDHEKKRAEQLSALNTALASDHLKASAEWKAEREIFSANHRRLERELREARATVMNEVGAMIPKAVEAERARCAFIARQAVIDADTAAQANLLMNVMNDIKERKG